MLETLPGEHSPGAFIEIEEGEVCHNAFKAPLMRPKLPDGSGPTDAATGSALNAFIIHPSAVQQLRGQLSVFFQQELGQQLPQPPTVIAFQDRMDRYGLEWLETTVGATAKDLKFYRLTLV